ncbi:unnamed protein product [Blepharisma stoltei]|uniref:UDENN domain-containing protein n=1 Tax=Blepharisma stoltei TaxID=1481888 RepID=A0AAU9JAY1_9CILI|nr:unnamed protein product [Blepharisma stoltei]
MENLFEEQHEPAIRLVDSILILGLSVKTLRNIFLEGKDSSIPELIAKLPPNSKEFTQDQINMIFTDREIKLEHNCMPQTYYSTTITNEKGYFTNIHCLITYERVTPEILEQTKSRNVPTGLLHFIPNTVEQAFESSDLVYYAPIALCLLTKSTYIDAFRNILESLYSYIFEINQNESSLISSIEFIRNTCFLLNDTIIPPVEVEFTIEVGKTEILLPVDKKLSLGHYESCVAILVDLVDITNIISFWESLLLSRHAFIFSCNEYLLFLALEAFKKLIFPMNWTMSYIPVLSKHLLDYLQVPVPVLIGLNNKYIPKEEAISKEPDAMILDIDSNILYNTVPSLLCDCEKALLCKKIQLLKAYYYVNYERLYSFNTHQLEESIPDKEFIKNAEKLLEPLERAERQECFVTLLRHAFLDIFLKGISKFSAYLVKDEETRQFEFQEDEFLQNISLCSESCKMKEFWKGFIDSVTFMQFLYYFGKFDESTLERFKEITKATNNKRYNIFEQNKFFSMKAADKIVPKELIEFLSNHIEQLPEALPEQIFIKHSAQEIIVEMQDARKQNKEYYETGELNETLVRISFKDNLEEKAHPNIFYGKHGIIRILNSAISCQYRSIFRQISTSDTIISENLSFDIQSYPDRWEPFAIKLLYKLRKNKKDWNMRELYDLCMTINRLNTDYLPRYHAASVVKLIYEKNQSMVRVLTHGEGVLSRIAKAFIEVIEANLLAPQERATADTEELLSPITPLTPRVMFNMSFKDVTMDMRDSQRVRGDHGKRKTRIIKFNLNND